MNTIVSAWISLLDLIAPDTCAGCQSPLPSPSLLFCSVCEGSCAHGLRQRNVGDLLALAVLPYEGALPVALRRFKFEDHPELARRFARSIHAEWGAIERALIPTDRSLPAPSLVPVPLHPRRLAERGFNQSALLARALSRLAGWPFASDTLGRRLDTAQQSRLSRDERLQNLAGAFKARPVAGTERVVLIDDVLTTGATITGCVHALQSAGYSVLGVITLAHAD